MNKGVIKKELVASFLGEGKISARFHRWNIALFALACFCIAAAMSMSFYGVIRRVSAEYAARYARSSANALSANVAKEVSLMTKAARSSAVIEWLSDETNAEKKDRAYEEMSGILGELYSGNFYVGFASSLNEYQIEKNTPGDKFLPFAKLSRNEPMDAWYFECLASDKDYIISVGFDHVLQKKRIWLDYKVVLDGMTLGVICTGLEFSHVTRELLAHYDNVARGMIIDSKGVINIDSQTLGPQTLGSQAADQRAQDGGKIGDSVSDPSLLAAIEAHLGGIDGYFENASQPVVIKLSPEPYRYATIAPITYTDWSAVILYDSSSSLNIMMFLPAFAATLALLVVFSLGANAVGNRLIFFPLAQLVRSLTLLHKNKDGTLYGLERNDELGTLSNTINDLFAISIRDALTNLYNRRYMENSLKDLMEFLSRSNGNLSVLMLDIDYFKKYNDMYGHKEGDACLKSVAHALAGSVTRTHDFVARYGGEEFIAVLPNTGPDGARVVAQKILDNVRLLAIPHEDNPPSRVVSVSIGVTSGAVFHTDSWGDYVQRADDALYHSKQNGRDRYSYFSF